jgi:predicted nucleic acid-binding protein
MNMGSSSLATGSGSPATSSSQLVVLDASVWVSRTLTTDSNHASAVQWIARHLRARGTFVVPTLFELEVAAAISRVTKNPRLARKQVAQLRRLNTRRIMRFVSMKATLLENATDLAVDFGLRAADAVYAAIARQLGIALVTFDAELLNLPTTTVTTIRP